MSDRFNPALQALADIRGLSLFSCKDKPLLRRFRALLEQRTQGNLFDALERWALLFGVAAEAGNSFYASVASLTLTDDNPFTHRAEAQDAAELSPLLTAAAKSDLSRLGRIAEFDLAGLGLQLAEELRNAGVTALAGNIEAEAEALKTSDQSPPEAPFFSKGSDWGKSVSEFAEYLRTRGAGILGRYRAFRWTARGICPVRNADTISLADLSGYGEQRRVIIANTLRFLEGKPANNLLLYGDRGTGKSAAVKAICNEYAPRGLRLIEVAKQDAKDLPAVLDALADRSLRFIIFIDDLSFETADDSFTALKRILEGGAEAKPPNTAVYATSNRRHLVKEPQADRPALSGDMRSFDTMEEQFSLADRFGLTVVFTAPGQDDFLSIAEYVAVRRGLLQDPPNPEERKRFRDNAIRWERWFNGRSPRTAAQYVDWLTGGAEFPWDL
ncbi:MAG: ATP-binding protein [Spirochaetaceae bacterium]|jgi:predicted AAA+ superfamily ATPase|nr:ATP-binding protein [Spirochaetaceae bacterium]